VAHAVGAEYLGRREHVEPKLSETCELPAGVGSVSVSVDRVSVPMEEPVAREERADWKALGVSAETTRKYGRELSPRTEAVLEEATRVAAGPRAKIQRNHRMAYCATVTLHDQHGEALHNNPVRPHAGCSR
jgi:hypothetical protein